MILGVCPEPNAGPIPTELVYARFPFLFFNLLQHGGFVLTTFLLVLLVGLGFVSGSIWILTAAIGALVAKLFPLALVLFAIVGAAYLAYHYFNER